MLEDSEVERALVVMAHPDDLDFGCSGTIAAWTRAGIEVSYCIITNGDAGGFDPAVPRYEIPGIRQEEQRKAGAVVGVSDIHFLGHHDGRLQMNYELRRDITRVIRKVRPQRVVCQSPIRDFDRMYFSHPDHLAAGEASLAAVFPDARNPFAHAELLLEEGWKEWAVAETWVVETQDGNHVVDVTDLLDLKLQAIWSHESQYGHAREWIENELRTWNGHIAKEAGLGDGRYAERFRVMNTA